VVLAVKQGGVELHFHFLHFESTALDAKGDAGLWALLQAGSVADDSNGEASFQSYLCPGL